MDYLRLNPARLVWLALAACAFAAHGQNTPSAPPKPLVNSIGMAMVRIPAGEFLMGSAEPIAHMEKDFPLMEKQRLEDLRDEAPVHRVRITRDFYLGQTEVTIGQFRKFLQGSKYVPESIADGTGGKRHVLSISSVDVNTAVILSRVAICTAGILKTKIQ